MGKDLHRIKINVTLKVYELFFLENSQIIFREVSYVVLYLCAEKRERDEGCFVKTGGILE